ncbi:MAG: transcriptional regulator [Dermatophilaceae bacterium]
MVTRVLYRDVIPYDTPSSLAALAGPAEGVLRLPVSVYWGPEATADLSTADGVEKAYENIVREGSSRQQEELLNADLLRRVWSQLRLPRRCRDLWQARFPELVDD